MLRISPNPLALAMQGSNSVNLGGRGQASLWVTLNYKSRNNRTAQITKRARTSATIHCCQFVLGPSKHHELESMLAMALAIHVTQ